MPKAAKAKKSKDKDESSESNGGITKGDIILIETETRLKEDNQLIDTTDRELAQKEGIYDENHPYGPQLIIVGDKWMLPSIDEELTNGLIAIGEEKEYEIPPSDESNPFGERNPADIKTISIREFKKANIDVRKNAGKRIDFKGKKIIILGERGGRVRVDYNHPLAGNTLIYKIKINSKLEDQDEIIDKILTMQFRGIPSEKFEKIIDENTKTIKFILPPEASMVQGIQMAKFGAARFFITYLKEFNNIEFIEKFSREFFEPPIKPPAPKEESPKVEEKEEAKEE